MHGAWFEFCIDSDGQDGMSLCWSGCLPPAVSGRADCRRNEPSEGVHVTRSTASRRSWPPYVDHGLCATWSWHLVPKIGAESSAEG